LNENGVYCYVETKAPTGYVVDSTPTYFYFTEQGKNYIESTGLEATGIGYNDKVFEVTNSFEPANVTIPLQKTINKKEQETTNQFSFTLTLDKAPDGAEVYSDQLCSKEMTSATTSIEGSGTTAFDTLYFLKAGEYVFTLTENNLTQVEIDEGFAKDATAYTIKVTVGDDLKVTAATFANADANADNSRTGDLTKGDVPVFNNTLTQTPVKVTLTATKVLKSTGDNTGRTIQSGEFNFEVLEDGKVIATGTTEAGETTAKIDFDAITYTQDQLGKHYLTVREVTGTDFTVDYSTVTFVAIVEVEPVQGKAELTATVKYSTQLKENLDENGNPIFTNSYTPITPTGIPTEFMPFAVMAVMAGSIGAVVMVRRWKRRLAGK
jgi:pilin isopeptide linkage protein